MSDANNVSTDSQAAASVADPQGHQVQKGDAHTLTRRQVLQNLGLGSASILGLAACDGGASVAVQATPTDTPVGTDRASSANQFRLTRAQQANAEPAIHVNNGDEQAYTNFIASFSKTLPHNDIGEVDPAAYQQFASAIDNFDVDALETVPKGGTARFINPFAGQAFTLSGVDGQSVTMPPAPTFDSAEMAAEMVDLYWMALCRDIPFADYGSDATIAAAVSDLNALTDYTPGAVSSDTIFRGILSGDTQGPYLSQFLYQPVPFGALNYPQSFSPTAAGVDYMVSQADAVNIQRGVAPGPEVFEPTPRHMITLRDLATFVHVDALHQAYLQAALILLGQKTPLDTGFPFDNASRSQGFATFGAAQVLGLVTEVSVRALKAAWYQKWNVHRRLRPEAMGLRVHAQMTGQASYPIHPQLLGSDALAQTFDKQGTYTLSQAYPEGSPAHPSFGAGHAAVAGACTTVLKALFDGTALVQNPVRPSADGSTLEPIADNLSVTGELNKLCSNISIGRDAAGVHYITDYSDCITMGESVAISILTDAVAASDVFGQLTLEAFDGRVVTITG